MKLHVALGLMLILGACKNTQESDESKVKSANQIKSTVAPLTVEGNRILAGGKVKSFAGNSLFWSNNNWGGEKFYNADVVKWLKSDWNSQIVRAAIGINEPGGLQDDKAANLEKLYKVVDQAIESEMYVIIDFHTHGLFKDDAIEFFETVALKYGKSDNVIYEIFNEPISQAWPEIKAYSEEVISAIRAIDPDNLIIVGTRVYSQRVDEAAANPIKGYSNIAYTLHFYAGTHKAELREIAQKALDAGVALFVTEWGTTHASGNTTFDPEETRSWMDFLKKNDISHVNWAINDKNETASALKPGASATGGWTDDQLTDSGKLVKELIKNWDK